MATLQISEYESIQQTMQGDVVHIPQTPPIAVQSVSYTAGTGTESGAFKSNTRFIRVATDDTTDANVAFGKGESFGNAGADHDRIPADAVAFFGVNPDKVDRLNVS